MTGEHPLLETWGIMQRVTLLLLDNIPPEALSGQLATGRGRSVGKVFAHLHNNRLAWLEVSGQEFMAGLAKIEVKANPESANDHTLLRAALVASGDSMARLFQRAAETGKIKGFKRSPMAFLGYAIAHESYHHGEIGIMLDQAGFKLDDKVAYDLWEWGRR